MNDDVHAAQSFLDRLMNRGAALGSREIGDDEHLLRQPVRPGTRGREDARSELAKEADDGGADTFRSRGDEHASGREFQVEVCDMGSLTINSPIIKNALKGKFQTYE